MNILYSKKYFTWPQCSRIYSYYKTLRWLLKLGYHCSVFLKNFNLTWLTFMPFYRSWKQIKEAQMSPTCMTLSKIIIGVHDGLQNQPIVRSLHPRILMKDIREYQNPTSMNIHNVWKKHLSIKTPGHFREAGNSIYFKKWWYSLLSISSSHYTI